MNETTGSFIMEVASVASDPHAEFKTFVDQKRPAREEFKE